MLAPMTQKLIDCCFVHGMLMLPLSFHSLIFHFVIFLFSCHILLRNLQEKVIPIAYSRSYLDLFLYELSICRDYLSAKIKRNTEIFLFQVDIHRKLLSVVLKYNIVVLFRNENSLPGCA